MIAILIAASILKWMEKKYKQLTFFNKFQFLIFRKIVL